MSALITVAFLCGLNFLRSKYRKSTAGYDNYNHHLLWLQ